MVWGCFCAGVGKLYRVKGIMDSIQYKQILIYHMFPSAKTLFSESMKEEEAICTNDCVQWKKKKKEEQKEQQEDAKICVSPGQSKHKAKKIIRYLDNKQQEVLYFPAQSPNLNPIENLWRC